MAIKIRSLRVTRPAYDQPQRGGLPTAPPSTAMTG